MVDMQIKFNQHNTTKALRPFSLGTFWVRDHGQCTADNLNFNDASITHSHVPWKLSPRTDEVSAWIIQSGELYFPAANHNRVYRQACTLLFDDVITSINHSVWGSRFILHRDECPIEIW